MRIQLGEVREIGIQVRNRVSDDFVIDVAEFSILDSDGVEIDKGYPTIDDHRILTLFNATDTGWFHVIFKYHIGPEILRAKISVEVI